MRVRGKEGGKPTQMGNIRKGFCLLTVSKLESKSLGNLHRFRDTRAFNNEVVEFLLGGQFAYLYQ